MATYLFAWNPAIWNWPELADDIRKLARRGHFDTDWSCSRHRNIEPGSRAFLVRLGVAPGISTNYTTLRLETLFDSPPITFDELSVPPFRRFRWGVRSSGTHLPETIADALEDLWEARVAATTRADRNRDRQEHKRAAGRPKPD